MSDHKIVAREDWVTARKELLAQEKEFTRLRDELTKKRQQLPWSKVEQEYVFEGKDGKESLAELFGECSQLIVYHFMFDPEWTDGCKSCSLLADHYNPAVVHLKQRDVELVTISRARLETLLAFQKRMGWSFKWLSSLENDFNRDFGVTFTPQELEQGPVHYNYQETTFPMTEAPGISAFYKDERGDVFHTYSSYARGLDLFITAYNLLDITPKGRDEAGLNYSMEWVRHHDSYGADSRDPYAGVLTPE